MSTTDRMTWLDIAKGLGIIFVFIGHTYMDVSVVIVYFFHMPLFFFLSGYVFRGEGLTFRQYAGKKVKRLLVPFYMLGIVMFICSMIDGWTFAHYNLKYFTCPKFMQLIYQFATQTRYGTLWYISTLFWMTLIFFGIYKLCKKRLKPMFIVCIVMLAIGFLYYGLGGSWLPINIDVVFTMMIFYFLGFWAKETRVFDKKLFDSHPLPVFFLFAGLCFVTGGTNWLITRHHVDIYYNFYGIAPLMYASSIFGILAIVCISKVVTWKPLRLLGEHSMIYYAWHQCMIYPLTLYVLKQLNILQAHNMQTRIATGLLCIVLSLLILTIPTLILRRFKWGQLFGVATR